MYVKRQVKRLACARIVGVKMRNSGCIQNIFGGIEEVGEKYESIKRYKLAVTE